jgi:UDP-glucose 4-epimerase
LGRGIRGLPSNEQNVVVCIDTKGIRSKNLKKGGVILKILVTGGAGFIGSHILEKLVKEGCQVVVIDNLSTGVRSNIPPTVKFIEMDIYSNELMNVFKEEKFDAVLHLAAQTMVPVSLKQPDYDCQVNIVGSLHVLEA